MMISRRYIITSCLLQWMMKSTIHILVTYNKFTHPANISAVTILLFARI